MFRCRVTGETVDLSQASGNEKESSEKEGSLVS